MGQIFYLSTIFLFLYCYYNAVTVGGIVIF